MAHFILNPDFDLSRLADAREPLRLYGRHREQAFRRNIRLGVDPYQQAYRPLSVRYAKEKARRWGNQPILWASGRMVKSHRVAVMSNRAVESLDSPAPAHQRGNPSTNLPKRPPLPDTRGLPASDRAALWSAVVSYAQRSFR